MYELKKIGKVFTSKSVGTGPSSYEKRIYRAAVSQRLRNTGLHHNFTHIISQMKTLKKSTLFRDLRLNVSIILKKMLK